MTVEQLIAKLLRQDQKSEVVMELITRSESSRSVITCLIDSIHCTAGGSINKKDNKYYGVVLRSGE